MGAHTAVTNLLLSGCCTITERPELLFLRNNTPVKIEFMLAGGDGPDDKLRD